MMTGLGFTEVMNFTVINEAVHYEKMRLEARNIIKLANPVSAEYTILRESILPSLLNNLRDNKRESFPQRLFEVSDVGRINQRTETRCERRLHAAGVSSHPTANYTEIKSCVEALLTNLGVKKYEIREGEHPSFLEGRVTELSVKRKKAGFLGEIHPQVLNNFELENPVSAFEIDLEEIKQ